MGVNPEVSCQLYSHRTRRAFPLFEFVVLTLKLSGVPVTAHHSKSEGLRNSFREPNTRCIVVDQVPMGPLPKWLYDHALRDYSRLRVSFNSYSGRLFATDVHCVMPGSILHAFIK